MNIQYAAYDPIENDLVCFGSYAEAVAAAEPDKPIEVWLFVDAWPILENLPDTYDRLTVFPDGSELRTSIIKRHEFETQWGPNGFGGAAPLLVLNARDNEIHIHSGEERRVLWPQEF